MESSSVLEVVGAVVLIFIGLFVLCCVVAGLILLIDKMFMFGPRKRECSDPQKRSAAADKLVAKLCARVATPADPEATRTARQRLQDLAVELIEIRDRCLDHALEIERHSQEQETPIPLLDHEAVVALRVCAAKKDADLDTLRRLAWILRMDQMRAEACSCLQGIAA